VARRVGANRRNAKRQRGKSTRARAQKHGRWIVAVGGVCALLAVVTVGGRLGMRKVEAWVRASDRFLVRAIEVNGNCRLARDEVVAVAGLSTGMKLLDVQPGKIQAALGARPWVERVSVRRWFPGKVSVHVTERTPVALVNVGQVYQVDERGILFRVPRGTYLSLPVLSGLRDTVGSDGLRRLTAESLERLIAFRQDVARSDNAWFKHLSQVDFSDAALVRFTLDGYPASVEIGAEDITMEMSRLRRLLEVLAEEDGQPVRSIRLSHHSMAYVRR
jgi:cell division protein FtsQ